MAALPWSARPPVMARTRENTAARRCATVKSHRAQSPTPWRGGPGHLASRASGLIAMPPTARPGIRNLAPTIAGKGASENVKTTWRPGRRWPVGLRGGLHQPLANPRRSSMC